MAEPLTPEDADKAVLLRLIVEQISSGCNLRYPLPDGSSQQFGLSLRREAAAFGAGVYLSLANPELAHVRELGARALLRQSIASVADYLRCFAADAPGIKRD